MSMVSTTAGSIRRLAFYDNTVEVYARHEPHHLRVRDLLHPVSDITEEKVIRSAQYVHVQVPIRLARMIRTLQNLPFVVGINPHVNEVYYIYWDAFQAIREFHRIETLQDEAEFSDLLDYLLERNKGQINILHKGLHEVRQKMGTRLESKFFNSFLDNFLREGMIRRLVISNHFALREAHQKKRLQQEKLGSRRQEAPLGKPGTSSSEKDDIVSVINHTCSPYAVAQRAVEVVKSRCEAEVGFAPPFIVSGDVQATFPCIETHLQYVVVEILKNAAQAATARWGSSTAYVREQCPPIEISIRKGTGLGIVISDQGGGIPPQTSHAQLYTYGYSNYQPYLNASAGKAPPLPPPPPPPPSNESRSGGGSSLPLSFHYTKAHGSYEMRVPSSSHIAGDGFGLPTARVYIRHLGGELALVSTYGYGCHAYLTFPPLSPDHLVT